MSKSVDALETSLDLLNEEQQDLFNKLPDELMILIFCYLSPEDLACRVSKVCLRWLTVVKDPVLWSSAVLNYNIIHPTEFQNTILFAPSLAKVEINMFNNLSDKTVQCMLSGSSSVKYLSFYPSPSIIVNLKLSILNFYCNLTVLNIYIDDSYLESDGTFKTLFKTLSNMNDLKMLTLRGLVGSEFFETEKFCNCLKRLKALDVSGFAVKQQENVSDSLIRPSPWQSFILFILENKIATLKKLVLPMDVFDYSMGSVLGNRFTSSTLINLKICESCLSVVKKLHCLEILHVVGMSYRALDILRRSCIKSVLSYGSLFQWISDVQQFSNIRELTLENIVHDERHLTIHILKACQNLESLTLFSGCSSPAQLTLLILELFPSLAKLSIHHMPCLRSKHLEIVAHRLPNLKVLNLRNNTLTDGILQYYRDHIQPRMPDLHLICDWGYWNKHGGKCWQTSVHGAQLGKSNQIASPKVLPIYDKETMQRILNAVNEYDDDD